MTRVLVVDDNEDNVYYLRTLLSAHGCDVESARHGAEALTKARELVPEVVISDLLMPVMDGYTLLRNWKTDPQLKRVPFIVYTATYTAPEDEQLARRLGADAFILKPSDPDAFVRRLLDLRASALAPSEPPQAVGDERELLREYNQALVRKLEKRTQELEESNRSLQADVAARKLVETALRASEERFRQLAESIDDVFCLSTADGGEILYVNPAFERVWGEGCDVLYRDACAWRRAVHPHDAERVGTWLKTTAEGAWDETFRIVRGDGVVRWIRASAFPVRDEAGRLCRIAGVARDITEQRRLEEQVRQAQKLEAIGRLARGIAHDFNNLLSAILGFTRVAQERLAHGESALDELEEVRLAGERAGALTKQLLAFSRNEVVQPEVLDLGQVTLGMQKMLANLLGEEVTLALRTPAHVGKVYLDPTQATQVIMNLAVNARDAMPDGGALTISVDNATVDARGRADLGDVAPGRYVMLEVCDDGVGMDGPTRERMFEPFFTTKEAGKGTGLGLATVYGIVTQSGGHIHVESELGRGTTIRVLLPRTDRAPDAEPSSTKASSPR